MIAVREDPDNTRRSLHAVGRLHKFFSKASWAKPESPKVRGEAELPQGASERLGSATVAAFYKGRYYPQLKLLVGDSTGLSASSLQTIEGLVPYATATPRCNPECKQ